MTDRVRRQIDDWARRLIDLSRRNRLLNFRPTKRGHLRIVEPDPDEILEVLRRPKGSWEVFLPPRQQEIGEGLATRYTDTQIARATRDKQRLVTDQTVREELEITLISLERRTRLELEEKGVNVLYLAVGLLCWESADGQKERSPILLLPVVLHRERVHDPWRLSLADEDPVLNPALAEKLRADFQLELPEPADIDDMSAQGFLAEVRRVLPHSRTATGWSVAADTFLGLYSFYKLVMYRDLSDNWERIANHAFIGALATGDPLPDDWRRDLPSADQLDDLEDPSEGFTVRDADGSQRCALHAVRTGASIVMQGPPGTGKSQTITNLIGATIADGKSVLFVSEKLAALEVVHRWLREAGLDDFCLELHSHKAAKKQVLEALSRSLECSPQPDYAKHAAERELQELRRRRVKLNQYAHDLHELHRDVGRTPFELHGEIARTLELAADVSELTPDSLDVVALDPNAQNRFADKVRELAAHLREIEERRPYLWRGFSMDQFSADAEAGLRDRCDALMSGWQRVCAAGREVGATLGLACTGEGHIGRLAKLVELLNTPAAVGSGWLMCSEESFAGLSALLAEGTDVAAVHARASAEIASDLGGSRLEGSCRHLDKSSEKLEQGLEVFPGVEKGAWRVMRATWLRLARMRRCALRSCGARLRSSWTISQVRRSRREWPMPSSFSGL